MNPMRDSDVPPPASAAQRGLRWLLRLPARVLIGTVHGYRLLLQPSIGNCCRYEPSCSTYALQCLHRHGALRGTLLAAWRVLRCNPLSAGGHDPVPGSTSPTSTQGQTRVVCGCAIDSPPDPIRHRS